MATDPEAYKNKTHTGRFIGAKGNEGMAVYNPETGGYERYSIEDWNNKSSAGRKESGNNIASHYTNRFGENVYGYRPENTHTGMLSGESFITAGKDPYADKYIRNDNGTPVPGAGMLNPDFVAPESRFQTRSGDAKISYAAPTATQAAWDNKIANFNPEERAAWESGVEGMLTGTLNSAQPVTPGQDVAPIGTGYNSPEFGAALEANPEFQALFKPEYVSGVGNTALYDHPDFVLDDTVYTQEDLLGMSNEEAFNLMNTHGEYFHANKDGGDMDSIMQQGRSMSTPAFLQKITDHVSDTKSGVQPFLNAARGLQYHNPAAFEEWELANPEMALRYHARAAAGNGQVGGIEGYDHAGRAQALSYGISQQLGYGEDGKQDGKAIAYNFDTFNDVNSENGDGDFWKLGTAQTFTNDLSDYIEDNPLQVAGTIALGVFAPQIVAAIAPSLGPVAAGVASGALTSVGNNLITGNTDDLLMSAIKGGVTGGLGAWGSGAEGILVKNFGFNESVANIATAAVGDAVANGTDPVQALITAAGVEGVTLTLGAAKDALGDMFSTDEMKVEIGADGTSTGTINQEALDEMDFLSKNPDALQEIDLGTIPSQRPPNSLGTPNIPSRDDGMLTGGSQGEALEPIDVGAITDQQRPDMPMRPELGQDSSYDGTKDGTEHITVGGESSRPTGRAPTQADLKAFDTADSLGLGDTLDEIMAANPGITGAEAFRLSMASSTSGVAMKPDVFEAVMAADDPIHYLNTYHPEYAVALGVDHRVSDIIGAQGTGNVNTNIGPGVNSPPQAIIGDPAATPQRPPQLPGSTPDSSGVEFTRPEDGYVPRDPDSLGGPLYEPDMPDLNMGFDDQEIILDSMDNTFTPDRFEPQWKLPEEEVKKITEDILGGGGNLASSVSDAVEGAIGDAPESVLESIESIVGDIGDNIGDIDLSAIGDMGLPAKEQVVEGIKVALGTVGASMDDIATEVNLGNGDVSEVSLEDAILGQGPTGPQGGSPSGPSGDPGGSVGAPSGTPGQPPTPNSNLPQGVAWEPNGTGGWNIRNSNTGEVFTQQEFAEAIYGNLVNGTGTTGNGGTSGTGTTDAGTGSSSGTGTGSHPGVVGGVHAGTGLNALGSSGTGGTGGGTGGGNGAGDGPGDGFGDGSDTPLADGLMRMVGGGTNVPAGLVDIPQVAPIQTRPLDWSFLRKVSEGRG